MLYSSRLDSQPPQAHLTITGELDAWSAADMRREIGSALNRGSTDFTVDASGVTFVDAGGLNAFVALRNATRDRNGTLTFVAASTAFVWVCSLAGLFTAFDLQRLTGRAALA